MGLAAALLGSLGLRPAGLAQESSTVAAQDAFTLERILSAPFPSDLVTAPDGGAIAWVRYYRGVRNIWIARTPDFSGAPLTSYTEDDGQEIGSLAFTPDASRLIFVRGGPPNRQGEIPNPTSEPEAPERAIWIVGLDGGERGTPRKLAVGSSPRISPDGSQLVFLERGQVWSLPLDADPDPGAALAEPPSAEPLFQIRGGVSSLTWAPAGDRIAFVSNRGDHSYVGVFEVATREVRYLDPSLDRDGSPVWSPDGGRIAFLRVPNERDRLPFAPRREGLGWSIRIVDVASGVGRELWRSPPGPGSAFRGVVADNQLLWAAGDRIVFPWEGDGWTHLYSIPAGGGEPTALTPGEFEVEHVVLAPDRREIVFSSNQGDIDRRHLWRVPVTGGAPTAITSGSGIEWSPAIAGRGEVAFVASDARTPAHVEILLATGQRRFVADSEIPAEFPMGAMVVPEPVVFEAEDGLRIHGQLFVPPGLASDERRPAVLFFHGGSRRQMLLGWHYLRYYHNTYAFNQYLAGRGYVVLSVNYRSGTGYGMEFREALDYGARGASEYRDVLAAAAYLASRSDVDPERIGLWGGSYGGYLTALGLARDSDTFAAGVDVHGVHDWNVVIRNFVPSYEAERRADVARLAFESSPMASVDGWRSPVLLVHGDDDRNVPFSESVDLVEALRRRAVEVEQLVFPDEVHGFLLHRSWLAVFAAAADFFDRKLMGAAAAAGGQGSEPAR